MDSDFAMKWLHFKHKCTQLKDGVISKTLTVALMVVLTALCTSLITGYKPLFVMSPSMEPVIMTHQFVLAQRVHDEGHDMNVGDIITYQRPNDLKTITHRIIQMEDDGYIVKGDNNESADPYTVRPEWIKYKIVKY